MKARFISLVLFAVLLLPLTLTGQGKETPKKGTVRAQDGVSIVYDIRGKGDTTLVFLHGWCGDRSWWNNQLDEFASDYRVVAVDQAGHGESGTNRKNWSVLGLSTDVQTMVKELGLKRVILVGHSMGGPISLGAAKLLPGTVVAVIGVDTLQNAEYQWPEGQAEQFAKSFEANFEATMRMGIKGMLPEKADPELLNKITSKAASQDKTMAIALFRDFPRLDTKALMNDAKVPIRCINSAPETQFATPTAIDINKKYADFDAVIMKGVGHFPMLEQPAEFNRNLREVLKEFATKN
jgi:pimeloyl-ACP methyl ester carboxylesterase